MICCFSGQKIPTDKLFVLYYPPSMAHQNWSMSVYAAARAREAVEASLEELRNFRPRYLIGKRLALHLAIGAVGLALLGYWGYVAATGWAQAGILKAFCCRLSGCR